MVAHLEVISITNGASSLGDSRQQLITFAAPTEASAEAVVDASVAAQMSLVRSGDTPPSSSNGTQSGSGATGYRAPAGPATRGGG